jgi:TolB-like protein/Tfp pilus assembly protein PilF
LSLIAELKRRRVFKVGAAYLVVAWLAVQAASIGFPAFDAPPWALRIFILVALLGFPVALVLAWVFETTPEGVKLDASASGSKRLMAVAFVLVLLALGWYFFGAPALRSGDSSPVAAATAPVADAHSIAVLPFVNMSIDPAQEFFSDGIAEELLNQLAQFPDLMVAARTSAFQFKGKNLDVADIGRKLNVAHVLEGSVRKEGARLRITAQLIKTATGFHLWSQTFERDASDVFKVQDEISTAIAKTLEAKLSGRAAEGAVPKAADPAAYDDYLLARSLVARRIGDSLPLAIAAFDRAIAGDPGYSLAHSGRAFALAIEPGWSASLPVDVTYPKALADADEAMRLDPGNAEAYMVRGILRSVHDYQQVAADADFDRALAVAPGSVDILNFVGDNFEFTGRLRAAERLKRQAMALDPLAFVHPMNLTNILVAQGRFREAVAIGEHAITLGNALYTRHELFWAYLRLAELDHARDQATAICGEVGADASRCLAVRIALHVVDGDRHALGLAVDKLAANRGAKQPGGWGATRMHPRSPRCSRIMSATCRERRQRCARPCRTTMTGSPRRPCSAVRTARACPRRSARILSGSPSGTIRGCARPWPCIARISLRSARASRRR